MKINHDGVTVGELREVIKDLPDNAVIRVWDSENPVYPNKVIICQVIDEKLDLELDK